MLLLMEVKHIIDQNYCPSRRGQLLSLVNLQVWLTVISQDEEKK